jgi:nucleotide-binding universal stress UspA family protein
MTVTSMGMTTAPRIPSVVVGVDDGLLRTRVLDRAVAEARRRDRTVRVVHVDGSADPDAPWYGDAGRRAESYLRRTAPDVEVRRTCTTGDPARVLAGACGASSLLVVGDRQVRLGSEAGRTTEELIAVAPCPVLVLGEYRGPSPVRVPPRSVVVVGIDEGPGATVVLGHAFRVAEMLSEPVEVVHAVDEVTYDAESLARRGEDDTIREEMDAPARIEGLVTAMKDRFPDVPTSVVVAEDRPARLLLEHARGADLVVVAHRGRAAGDLVGLGSTTRSLLLGAPCPVLVLGPQVTDGIDGPRTVPAGVVR